MMRMNDCVRGLFLLTALATVSAAENWPRFRGSDGSGIAPEQGIPTTWKQSDYKWVVDLPGEGHGAPVIWGKSLFVTSAIEGGLVRSLYCLDADTGETRWVRSMGFNSNRKHQKNSFASSTPATDGERVYVAFADQERCALAAYDMEGTLVWRNWLGPFSSQHGLGASPIVFEDLVIMPNDQDGPSSIMAYDRRDGKLVWSTLRPFREASYATPIIVEKPGQKPELICLNGATGISALDPWTGLTLWQSEPLAQRTVSCPVVGQGKIYATCGQGGKGTILIGVDMDAAADGVAPTTFRREKTLPYVPCLIAFGDYLYMWNDNGVVMCVDPATDKTVWQERIGGNFSGSPIVIGGKIYCIDESGKVAVLDASPTHHFYGFSELGDNSHSTPAVANGKLYLRSFHRLACLAAPESAGK